METPTHPAPPVELDRLVRCSICERYSRASELKEADDYDPQGNHRYLQICPECEDDFEKMDITFSFKANNLFDLI